MVIQVKTIVQHTLESTLFLESNFFSRRVCSSDQACWSSSLQPSVQKTLLLLHPGAWLLQNVAEELTPQILFSYLLDLKCIGLGNSLVCPWYHLEEVVEISVKDKSFINPHRWVMVYINVVILRLFHGKGLEPLGLIFIECYFTVT